MDNSIIQPKVDAIGSFYLKKLPLWKSLDLINRLKHHQNEP